MPQYSISTGVPTFSTTVTPLTLGYGPNMTAPPDLLFFAATGGGTIVLPAIKSILPTPPGTPGTSPGCSDGYSLKIKNTGGGSVTLTPAGSDTIDAYNINGLNDFVSLQCSLYNTNWNNLSGTGAYSTVRYVSGNFTVATTDKVIIDSTAGTGTLLAPTTYPAYTPFVTVISSNVLVTISPTSGNINGLAALTIAAGSQATIFGDGTNFFRSA